MSTAATDRTTERTFEPTSGHAPPHRESARSLPWFGFGVANLAVVLVLGFASWYLLADPSWGIGSGSYPQPLTAWMFWTIIAFVWFAFNLELSPFTKLGQPWRGLAVLAATAGLGAVITWVLAYGWGAVDHSFAADRAGGVGYVLGSLIVLYSFVTYTMSAVNFAHWPWSRFDLDQPRVGIVELGMLGVPTVILYLIFAVPALAEWAKPSSALLDPNQQIGLFYCVVVSSILTGAVLENWPWRLARTPGLTALNALVGNLVIGTGFYFALRGVAWLVIGSHDAGIITSAVMPVFAAQVGVCWVFWMVMWPNAFENRPVSGGLARILAGRTVITFVLAVATFALYYYVIGRLMHEPVTGPGTTIHGSALVGMDWLIIWALWYVVAAESWGLPKLRSATPAVAATAEADR